MDESGKLLERSCVGSSPTHDDLLKRGWSIVPSAVTLRRSALEKVGGFCEEFMGCAGGEDQYMWLLLSECGEFEYVAQPLMIYRMMSPAAVVEKYERGRQTFIRLLKARYGTIASKRIRETQHYFAGMLVVGATEELDAGNLLCALRLIRRAHRYRPFLLFDLRLAAKLVSARNLRRLAKSFLRLGGSKTP